MSDTSSTSRRSFWSAFLPASTGSSKSTTTSTRTRTPPPLDHDHEEPDDPFDEVGYLRHDWPDECAAYINLPLHGLVYIPSPPDTRGTPRPTRTTVTGEVEIRIPEKWGRRRCRGIHLIRRAISDITLGEDRQHEIDVLSDRVQRIRGETCLTPGVTRIPFAHELEESILSVDGRGKPHMLLVFLSVVVIGDMTEQDRRPWFRLDGIEQLQPPDYDPSDKIDSTVPLLEKTLIGRRLITTKHNPSPDGTTCRLDDHFNAFVPDVGLITARCFAKHFTVAGPVIARLEISTPAPAVTIYAFRLSIQQTAVITSPRDGYVKETVTETPFALIGKVPRSGPVPLTPEYPALWRGEDVGGVPDEPCVHVVRSRFPHADDTRWTTLMPCDTPVLYSHMLVYEIFFSVYGQDRLGKTMPEPGPGALRVVKRQLKIILPNCSLTPALMHLPTYRHGPSDLHEKMTYAKPCPQCGIPPSQIVCTTCPSAALPHVSHEHPCAACRHSSLLPPTAPITGIWKCECDALEAARLGHPDPAVAGQEFDDPDTGPTERFVQRDGMLAVKLEQEWQTKQ